MENLFYLKMGLAFYLFILFQYIIETALYFTLFSKFTGPEIVLKKDDSQKFKKALIIQFATASFFILLEIIHLGIN